MDTHPTYRDLLLCFLYSPGMDTKVNEPITGRTKLTKMLFIFWKELAEDFVIRRSKIDMPLFRPYCFGPFSPQLFDDLKFFEGIGMLHAEETAIPLHPADRMENDSDGDEQDNPGRHEMSYSLTKTGRHYVEDELWGLLTQTQKDKLKAHKAQINRCSSSTLLAYIGKQYPEEFTGLRRKPLAGDGEEYALSEKLFLAENS